MTPDANMVERVARAITDELLRQRISPSFGRNLEGVNPPLDVPAIARAAIAAMRDPTEAMLALGALERGFDEISDAQGALNIFTAMIDAALAEGPKG